MTSRQGDGTGGVRGQLQLIYDLFRQESAWPTFQRVDLRFDRQLGIEDAQAALTTLPSQYLSIPSQTWGFSDSDEVRLTLAGILECNGGSGDLQLLVEFIRWATALEQSSEGDELPVLHSVDFAAHALLEIHEGAADALLNARAGNDRMAVARLKLLVESLPHFWTRFGSKRPWDWELTLDRRRFRPYRAIDNVEQLLAYTEQLGRNADSAAGSGAFLVAAAASLTGSGSLLVGSGVEPDDTSAGTIDEPFDPERIDVATRNPTVSLLLSRLRRGALDLQPEFQRIAGIWSDQSQSRLIESMLLRIPLPTFYAAESVDDNWRIVDGVQRLTTIARFVDPASTGQGGDPLVLHGLEYLWRQYDGATFADLPGRLQTRLLETELVVHLIRPGTPEPVMFNIFARINTGGRPLTRQELRHALIPGAARDLLRELADADPFLRATLGSVSPKRMDDREMVLRFIAFRFTEVDNYRPDFDEFLRVAMRRVNKLSPSQIAELRGDFNRAMDAAHRIFGGHAFRKRYPGQERRSPVNKALFESIAVNLAELSDGDVAVLTRLSEEVIDRFSDLLDKHSDFDRSISVATGHAARVQLRFNAIRQLFGEVLDDWSARTQQL